MTKLTCVFSFLLVGNLFGLLACESVRGAASVVAVFGRVLPGVVIVGLVAWVAAVESLVGVGEFEELDVGLIYVAGAAAGVIYPIVQHTKFSEWPKLP